MFKETSSLRNSLYVLYFTQSEGEDPSEANKSKKAIFLNNKMASLKVEASLLSGAYWRCRYCDKGSEKFLALQEPQHHLATQIETRYNDQCKNFNGHNLKVISMLRFPYMDFARLEEQDGKNWGAKIALKDSVDIRMLRTFAEHLNFTYEVREPVDRIWGKYPVEGRWPGIVGPMDREEADFSSVMAPTPSRLTAINHERLYPTDELVLISLKPHIQVDSLALVKPFPENVWAFILISVLVWSVFLWAIENLWAHLSSGHTLNIMDVLFYGFGILLEDTPTFKPTLASGTIMAGWWMMISLVMQSAYRSSLMAHLIVLEKSKPVETFGDLLKLSDWSWGIEPWMLSGAVGVYFQRTQDPVMQQMYQNLELIELEENLQRVEDGKHSFIAWRSPITVTVSSRYAEESRNPFYISRNGYPLLADFGWGFRKGAPFRRHFRQLMTRMMESGILDRWQKEVMDIRVRQNRKERASTPRKDDASSKLKNAQNEDSGRNIVLAMKHLQAAFYFFFCGHGVAFVIFVLELCIVKGKLLLKKQNDLMDL
ncbi:hypothetical protein SK128_004359 [Halocaridina rubra]|uniref:Ionotropic glutamate receptor C-terminal domain-containing protein n=1 Tax=Halocaridina rubra TaxID=373956 RepID=A0AAN8XAD1_HALRR